MSNKGLGVVFPDCNSRRLSKNSFLETLKVFSLFCRLWDESRKRAPILPVAVFTHAQVQHVKCTADGKTIKASKHLKGHYSLGVLGQF